MSARVIRHADVPLYGTPDGIQKFRATLSNSTAQSERTTGGWYSVAAGRANHEDTHPDNDEVYYILRGGGQMLFDDEPQRFGVGDTVFVPAGTRHRIVSDAGDDVELFYFFVPPPRSSGGPPSGFVELT